MNKERLQKIAGILKEASDKQPSSITARSPLAVEILKKAFKQASPKTKYTIKDRYFEFDLQSFLDNYNDVGIDEERAIKIFFMPIAKTIQILEDWVSVEDVIFLAPLD